MNIHMTTRPMTCASVRPVQNMILEVLGRYPQGVKLVPLHVLVDAELVSQRIWRQGCSYQQVRGSLKWLRDNDLVFTTLVPRTKGYYLYRIKPGAPVLPAPCKAKRVVVEPICLMPARQLSPMAFALHTLASSPGTWDPEQEIEKPPAPAASMWPSVRQAALTRDQP